MKKNNKKRYHLSHSAIQRYNTCGVSYKLHYIDKLREQTTTSQLAFGKAIDNALNVILADFKINGKVTASYEAAFDEAWLTVEINEEEYYLPDLELVGYAKKDFYYELLTNEDKLDIQKWCKEYIQLDNVDVKELQKELQLKKDDRSISLQELRILNLINWHCMRRKGHGMLEAYIREILPEIAEVVDIQKEIKFTTEDNVELIGFIDAIIKPKKYNNLMVLDNKTSRRRYEPKDLYQSQQLALYTKHEDVDFAAFAVMLKDPKIVKTRGCSTCLTEIKTRRKKCEICKTELTLISKPVFETQFLMGKVEEQLKTLVMENALEVKNAIDKGVFVKNLNSCYNQYGSRCTYFDLCHKGNSDNLIKLEEKEKK